MKKATIYTNGKQLFTLESYGKTAGVCHENNIAIHSEVDKGNARAMHEKGQLHYIFGIGDSKVLSNATLKRGKTIGKFTIN